MAAVMVGGFYYTQDELKAPFDGKMGGPIASAAGLDAKARAKATHARPVTARQAFAASTKHNDFWWHNETFVVETMKMCCVQV